MKTCLIFIEKNNYKNSADLIEVAKQIFVDEAFQVYGLSINNDVDNMQSFDFIFKVSKPRIMTEDAKVITNIIDELHKEYKFDCILIPATYFGRMLAPRTAMRLHTGLTADVTGINHHKGVLEMIRPAFSGKIMAAIKKIGHGPIMLSVRQNVFHKDKDWMRDTKIIEFIPKCDLESSLALIEEEHKEASYDISDSKVLISGGGGIVKDFHKLDKLAQVLNGEVSASRMIIDKGIATRAIQVGQSGKTVSPNLYLAIGINGAIQHVEGLKNVQHIISVNTNIHAPICSLSDLVVQGDGGEFVDKLIERIKFGG